MEGNKSFILLGTLEAPYGVQLLAFGLCLPLFVVTALSNLLVLGTVAVQRELHKPMYAFMCNLVLGDLIGCTVILPKQLHIFLTGDNEVSRASCVAQMFCMNVFISTECVTLTVMSVDRYVAICHPLHYHAIVTARRTLLVVVAAWSFTAALLVPLTILVMPLTLKDNDRQMPGIFCDYMGFIRLSADDTSVPEAYSSGMVALLFVLPLCVISVTYCKILLECKRTQASGFRRKATHTLLTHSFLLTVFFTTLFVSILVPRLVRNEPNARARNIRCASQFATFFIPIANVGIYFFRTRALRKEAATLLRKMFPSSFRDSRPRRVWAIVNCVRDEIVGRTSRLLSAIYPESREPLARETPRTSTVRLWPCPTPRKAKHNFRHIASRQRPMQARGVMV
ncbi:olfactory receptor 1M1-like [Callorhinchus milii]|uniref:olfactory receptor 1M1-like n=1 Tax=Callorhinchus milii TaxID=7868 RepID=UPI001C3FE0FF|nr:olfactory receptor 1M1-like [Callorhinchus milii]